MENENYAELFKYCSPKSILVVTWYGKLRTLYCPFGVKVLSNVGLLKAGQYVKVEEVKLASNGKTVFIVEGSPYYYYNFDILTHL